MTKKKLIKKIIVTIILSGVFLVIVPDGFAATYYVAKNGLDSNSGSETYPFLTIQKAADVTAPGDTVYVKAGTYDERIYIKKSGTSSAYISFEKYQSYPAIADEAVITRGFTIAQPLRSRKAISA